MKKKNKVERHILSDVKTYYKKYNNQDSVLQL